MSETETGTRHTGAVDIAAVLEEQDVTWFAASIFISCCLVMLADGFDNQAINYAAPAIIEEWDLLTESDLKKLETRLERVSDEISGLYAGRMTIELRAKALDELITSLERSK